MSSIDKKAVVMMNVMKMFLTILKVCLQVFLSKNVSSITTENLCSKRNLWKINIQKVAIEIN